MTITPTNWDHIFNFNKFKILLLLHRTYVGLKFPFITSVTDYFTFFEELIRYISITKIYYEII